jgi:hypothetical protein
MLFVISTASGVVQGIRPSLNSPLRASAWFYVLKAQVEHESVSQT